VILPTVGAADPVGVLKYGESFELVEDSFSNAEHEIDAAGHEREDVVVTSQRRTRRKENAAMEFV
jgi:hypothetical protein